jgi:bacteriophage N4 adsorption protein B
MVTQRLLGWLCREMERPGVTCMDQFALAIGAIALELMLFAGCIFLAFGIDDLLVDGFWLAGMRNRRERRFADDAVVNRKFVVTIAAWRESAVIGPMLTTLCQRWPQPDLRIIVGVYPNDLPTMIAVARAAANDPRIAMAVNPRNGPTTKGDCLNTIWRSVEQQAASGSFSPDALLVHDAEDLVDPLELAVLDDALDRHDYAQLPVVPSMAGLGRWVARHYCDEFAEAHGKELVVRSEIGAPLPTAGVGCAFSMAILRHLDTGIGPFSADCLTEDYELGLRLARMDASGTFVRARSTDDRLIASRALFPQRLDQSVRQKTRWLRGIALDGWDRLGWPMGSTPAWRPKLAAAWMLWRDRRVVLTALAIALAYLALAMWLAIAFAGYHAPSPGPVLEACLVASFVLFLWRLAMRGWHSGCLYGVRQGAMAVLRQPISNIILVMTAWRAIVGYVGCRRGQPLRWDKTDHVFIAL